MRLLLIHLKFTALAPPLDRSSYSSLSWWTMVTLGKLFKTVTARYPLPILFPVSSVNKFGYILGRSLVTIVTNITFYKISFDLFQNFFYHEGSPPNGFAATGVFPFVGWTVIFLRLSPWLRSCSPIDIVASFCHSKTMLKHRNIHWPNRKGKCPFTLPLRGQEEERIIDYIQLLSPPPSHLPLPLQLVCAGHLGAEERFRNPDGWRQTPAGSAQVGKG